MATLDDVASMVMALPGVSEGLRHGRRTWFVGNKGFVWERPLSKADIKRYGTITPPDGPLLGVATADLGEKEAVLAEGTPGIFTIPHFDGYPAVLVQLRVIGKRALRAAILDAWLAGAPTALADEYMAQKSRRGRPS